VEVFPVIRSAGILAGDSLHCHQLVCSQAATVVGFDLGESARGLAQSKTLTRI
jgi:hypothetical protein